MAFLQVLNTNILLIKSNIHVSAPSKEVSEVKVVPITTTSVQVEWEPVPEGYWSGDTETGGYRIVFQPVSDFPTSFQATPKQEVRGIKVTSEYIFSSSILTN